MDTQFRDQHVANIVSQNYRSADVFKKYKIDFCCGGKRPLSEICIEKNLDINAIENELKNTMAGRVESTQDFNQWPLGLLAEYIISIHHDYVKENIPVLLQYTEKVARVHGEKRPEVIAIKRLFFQAAMELDEHMQKEERILFPYIRHMEKSQFTGERVAKPGFGSINNPVNMMENEHESVGDLFKQMRDLGSDFQPPEGACHTYRVLYAKLDEFENDLHRHIHLENNILFPKAIRMEQGFVATESDAPQGEINLHGL